jgi:hypothetical protein
MAKQPIRYSNGRVPDSRIGVPGFSEERDVFGLVGRAGIGSTEFVADYNLDIRGDLKATRIIDVDGSDGEFAYFLTRDIDGLRWVAAPPFDTNAIFIAEDGDILGVTSFTGINIISDQLLGISTNTINPNLADIRLDPRWLRDRSGESTDEETAGIYTTRKVGIGSTIPQYFLDVVGDAQIDGNLNVTGVLTALSIDGSFGDFGDIETENLFVNGISTFVGPSTFFNGISIASTGGPLQVGGLTTITSGIISTRTVDANFVNVFDFETVQFRSQGIATFTGIGITVNQANIGVLTVRDFLDVDAGIATFSEDTTVFVGGGTTIRSGILSTGTVDAKFVNVEDFTTILLNVTGIATARTLNVLGAGLTVAGVTTLTGALDANGDVDVDGQTELDDLNVSGVSTFAGAIDANSSLNVEGISTFQSDATFQQDATVDQNLLVSGASTVTGPSTFQSDASFLVDVTIDENLLVTGITTLNDLLDANNGARINDINLAITGENIIDTNVGILTLDSAGNSVIVDSDFLVTGVTTFQNISFFEQNSTFDENVSIGSSVIITGVTTIGGFTDINNTLDVQGDALVGGGLSVIGESRLDGTVSAGSSINAPLFVTGAGSSGFTISTDTILGPEIIFIDPQSPLGINSGIVRIRGDLFVDGSQFTVDSSIIELADFKVAIATGIATEFLLDGAGIGIGSENIQKNFVYSYSAGVLQSDTGLGVTATGAYKVGVDTVLSAGVLGPTITESSLEDVGELRELIVLGVATALTFNGQILSGIGTITNLITDDLVVNNNAGIRSVFAQTGFITALAGQNADFDYGNFDILNTEVGIGTTMSGENLYYTSGVITNFTSTAATIENINSAGFTTLTNVLVGTALSVAGLADPTGIAVTLAGQGGITTTGGDLYVGGDLYIAEDLSLDNINAINGNFSGILTTKDFYATGITSLAQLQVTGVSTFQDFVDVNADLDVSGTVKANVGIFTELYAQTGVVTNLSGTNAYYSVVDTQTLQAVTGIVTDLSGTNAYYSVVDAQTLQAVAGVVTDISGTNAFYTTGDLQTLNAVTGVITNFTGGLASVDQLNSTGVVTASRLDGTADNRFSGLSSNFNAAVGILSAGTYVGGAFTQLNFIGTNLEVTVDPEPGNITQANINILRVAAADDAETAINVIGGIASVTTLDVSGISTLTGQVLVENDISVGGVITATNFIGAADDRFTGLSSNFNAAVGLSSAGTYVGGAFTNLNFSGTNLVVTVDPEPGNITQGNINILRVAGADEAETAINVIGGVASVTSLDVTGLTTLTGQVLVEGDVNVLGVVTANAFNGNINAGTGTITDLNGTNLYYNVGDFQTLQAVTGVVTDLSGTNLFYNVGDFQTLQAVAGVVTDLRTTNSFSTVVDTQELFAVSGVVTNLTATAATITDLRTTNSFSTVTDTQELYAVTGVVTDLSGTNAYYSVGDFQTLQAVTGIITNLSIDNSLFVNTLDAQLLQAVTGVITNFTGGLASVDQLNSTGVVTASRFDGTADNRFSGLSSNFNAAIGIQSAGDFVGASFTTINFVGTGLTVLVTPNIVDGTIVDVDIVRVQEAQSADFSELSGVATSVIGGIASVTALDVVGLTTLTGQVLIEGDVNVLGVVTANAFNGNINAGTGTITDLNGTNAFYNIGDFQTLNAVSGIITNLNIDNTLFVNTLDAQLLQGVSGVITNFTSTASTITDLNTTNIFSTVVDTQELYAVSGVITNFTGTAATITDLNTTNIFSNVVDTQELYAVTGVVTDLSGTNAFYNTVDVQTLNAVSGVITDLNIDNTLFVNTLDAQLLQGVSGVITDLSGTNAFYSVGDFQTLQGVVGVITDLSGTNAFYNVVDAQTLQGVSGVVTTLTSTDVTVQGGLQVNGFATITQDLTVTGDLAVGGVLTYEDVRNVDSIGLVTARVGLNVGDPTIGIAVTISSDGNGDFTGIVTALRFVGETLEATGVVTTNNLFVTGPSTFEGPVETPSLVIDGDGAVGGNLEVTGITTLNQLEVNDLVISGILTTFGFIATDAYIQYAGITTLNAVSGIITNLNIDNSLFVNTLDAQLLQAVTGVVTDLSGTNAFYNVVDAQTLQGVAGVVTDLSGTNAYYSVVDAQTLQGVAGVVTDLSGTNAYYSVGDFQTLQAVTGVVTDLSGTNAFYNVVDAQTLQGVVGVVTDLSGTNAFYDVVDAQTLQGLTGVVTDLSGTNAYYSVGDLQTLQAVSGVVTDLSGTNAFYSVVDAQTLQGVAGVVTDLSGTNAYYSVGDFQTLQGVAGVVTDLSGSNAYYTTGDFQTLQGVAGVITDLSGTNAYYSVGDLQTLQAVAGVVTDLSGTNAYYSVGDLQTLQAVTGVVTDLRTTNLFSTVVDTQELYAVTGVVTNFVGTSATVFDQFNVGVGGTILTAFYNFLPGNAGIASVGIGSANPQELLDVGGDARIGGNLNVVGILTAQNVTEFKFADDISSGFNGITTQFTLSTDGTNYLNSEITTSARLLISVGGIVQQPDVLQQVGYYISGGTDRTTDPITLNFAEAPRAGAAFFGIIYGLTIAPSVAYVTQETSIINAIIFG